MLRIRSMGSRAFRKEGKTEPGSSAMPPATTLGWSQELEAARKKGKAPGFGATRKTV